MKKASLAVLFWLLASAVSAHEDAGSDNWSGARPDGHAPIGVMGEHTHKAGEWMFSYRYMHMSMRT